MSSAKKKKSEPIKTVLTITVGFLAIYFITKQKHDWMLLVAFGVGFLGLLSTFLSEKIDFLWMKLTWILGLIMPNILLSIVFFIFLFPIAILARVFGKKDPLYLKNNYKSTYREINRGFDKASFEKPW